MLHIEHSWWLWLLLVSGPLVIYAQYKRGVYVGIWKFRLAIFFQVSAFIVILFQVFQPIWIGSHTKYHVPRISVWIDESKSFSGGRFLHHKPLSLFLEDSIRLRYEPLGFEVDVFRFSDSVWSGSDFRRIGHPGQKQMMTRLASVFQYISDTANYKNLQALFLFSDGRNTLPPNSYSNTSAIPIYPIIARGLAYADGGLDSAFYNADTGASVALYWTVYADSNVPPRIAFNQNGKQVWQVRPEGECTGQEFEFRCRASIPWPRHLTGILQKKAVKAILSLKNDSNPINDTASLEKKTEANKTKIIFFGPNKSPDARWLASIFRELPEYRLQHANKKSILALGSNSKAQIWISYSNFRRYFEKEGASNPQVKNSWIVFADNPFQHTSTSNSSLKAKGRAKSYYPLFHKPLNQFGRIAAFPKEFSQKACLVEASQALNRCLVARSRFHDHNFIWFGLQNYWPKMFDPSFNTMIKEQIHDLVAGTVHMAQDDHRLLEIALVQNKNSGGTVQLFIQKGKNAALGTKNPVVNIKGRNTDKNFPFQNWISLKDTLLDFPQLIPGKYQISLRTDSLILWSSSFEKKSPLFRELRATFWNKPWLSQTANQTGGSCLTGFVRNNQMDIIFPSLASGHLKRSWSSSHPLFNLPWTFGLAVFLLCLGWVFRKWAQID